MRVRLWSETDGRWGWRALDAVPDSLRREIPFLRGEVGYRSRRGAKTGARFRLRRHWPLWITWAGQKTHSRQEDR